MELGGWAFGAAALVTLALVSPWWTPGRTRARVLSARFGRRGRHVFPMPAPDPERCFAGRWRPFGRSCGQWPDAQGRGGWFGFVDLWGRIHVGRWLDPPQAPPVEGRGF